MKEENPPGSHSYVSVATISAAGLSGLSWVRPSVLQRPTSISRRSCSRPGAAFMILLLSFEPLLLISGPMLGAGVFRRILPAGSTARSFGGMWTAGQSTSDGAASLPSQAMVT
jgi:hypothetical protein